jgi:hypothetical protein
MMPIWLASLTQTTMMNSNTAEHERSNFFDPECTMGIWRISIFKRTKKISNLLKYYTKWTMLTIKSCSIKTIAKDYTIKGPEEDTSITENTREEILVVFACSKKFNQRTISSI